MSDQTPTPPADNKPAIPNPADAKSVEVFMKLPVADLDENTARALMGFYIIWAFEGNHADFKSPKINLELVKKLHAREITIGDFVKDSLNDEISSKLLLDKADSFSKYYFKWKYISDAKTLLGDTFEASWENYTKLKVKITERFTYWAQDPQKALDEKLKESDPTARAGQLSVRGDHVFTIPPHPNTTFDEENFLILLEGSISLTMEEKQRVIQAIPRLKIEQIDELISIFTEEKQKFSELENEFADDVKKLKEEREKEIIRTEEKKEEIAETGNDAEEAERIKREMGL